MGRWKSYGDQKTLIVSSEHDVPKLFKIGNLGAGPGAQWECRCGKTHEAQLRDGRLRWDTDSDVAIQPTRSEVVDRMMLTLPTGIERKADYPGEAQIRSTFLVALYALDRLKLNGGWRAE